MLTLPSLGVERRGCSCEGDEWSLHIRQGAHSFSQRTLPACHSESNKHHCLFWAVSLKSHSCRCSNTGDKREPFLSWHSTAAPSRAALVRAQIRGNQSPAALQSIQIYQWWQWGRVLKIMGWKGPCYLVILYAGNRLVLKAICII